MKTTNHDLAAVPSTALLDGFVPAFFPDCSWCVLSPWIATLDGKPYRLHCADNLTEEEARHIAYQLERYAHPKEEAMAYANAHTPNRQALRRAGEKPERIDMPDDYQEPNDPTLEEEAEARSRVAFCSALARQFHERYEEIAPLYGYKTREDTKTFDPESPNGQLMQAVCLQVVGPIVARLQAIASMPEYDQDDAHRLRDMARRFLSQNTVVLQ